MRRCVQKALGISDEIRGLPTRLRRPSGERPIETALAIQHEHIRPLPSTPVSSILPKENDDRRSGRRWRWSCSRRRREVVAASPPWLLAVANHGILREMRKPARRHGHAVAFVAAAQSMLAMVAGLPRSISGKTPNLVDKSGSSPSILLLDKSKSSTLEHRSQNQLGIVSEMPVLEIIKLREPTLSLQPFRKFWTQFAACEIRSSCIDENGVKSGNIPVILFWLKSRTLRPDSIPRLVLSGNPVISLPASSNSSRLPKLDGNEPFKWLYDAFNFLRNGNWVLIISGSGPKS
nr:hypothetical protein Iba_chr12fCG19940 [Ipomoea batatas]